MPYGRKTGGRTAGTPNLTTETKEALERAFEGIGGVSALTAWAKDNPSAFYPLYCRLLPKDVNGSGSGPVVIRVERDGEPSADEWTAA